MQAGEIGDFALNYTRKKARELVRQYGFPASEVEDCQQEFLQDLVGRLRRYDPAKSPLNAFIALVINNKFASIVEQRMSPSQGHLLHQLSLDEPFGDSDRPLTRTDQIDGSDDGSHGGQDLKIDVQTAVEGLPAELQQLWVWKVQGMSFTEISTRTGVPRPSLYDRWEKIVQHLKACKIEDYFCEK
jgi:RNA polymerase sigma factor (sigma-70 family)